MVAGGIVPGVAGMVGMAVGVPVAVAVAVAVGMPVGPWGGVMMGVGVVMGVAETVGSGVAETGVVSASSPPGLALADIANALPATTSPPTATAATVIRGLLRMTLLIGVSFPDPRSGRFPYAQPNGSPGPHGSDRATAQGD